MHQFYSISILFLIFFSSCQQEVELSSIKQNESVQPESVTSFDISTTHITSNDLFNVSSDSLIVLKNWIYAKQGYTFKSTKWSTYFSSFEWYQPNNCKTDTLFTELQKENIRLIEIELNRWQTKIDFILNFNHDYNYHLTRKQFIDSRLYYKPNKKSSLKIVNYKLKETSPSYFNTENTKHTFFFLARSTTEGVQVQDNGFELSQYLLPTLKDSFQLDTKFFDYTDYKSKVTQIKFHDSIRFSLLTSKGQKSVSVNNWIYEDDSEYAWKQPNYILNTHNIKELKIKSITNDDFDFIDYLDDPLMTFGFIKNDYSTFKFSKFKLQSATFLEKLGGEKVKGKSIDVDGDGIHDVFWANERLGPEGSSDYFTRLFINIDGSWILTWTEFYITGI